MNLGLDGKRVVITGSSRGIGLAAARLFLEEGAHVLLNGTDRNRLDAAVETLGGSSAALAAAVADVSTKNGSRGLFEAADTQLGGVDILINNAGIYRYGTAFTDLEDAQWEESVRINLESIRHCSAEAVRRMRAQQAGVILNASSYAAVTPSAGAALYAALKSAVLSLTRTMAAECAPHGIRVNAYIPGVIETDMTAELREANGPAMRAQIALARFGTADEAAAPIVFLASERASYITGTALDISGGKLCVQRPDAPWA